MNAAQKQTAGLAIASLVLGIAGFVLIGPLGAIPAVICGHIAKSRIKKSQGALGGDGMALAGLILGYVNMGLMILIIPMCAAITIPAFVRARDVSQQNACINNLRIIDSAKEQWTLAERKDVGDSVDVPAVNHYIKGATTPECPAEGTYTYNPIGQSPTCSKPKHELPAY